MDYDDKEFVDDDQNDANDDDIDEEYEPLAEGRTIRTSSADPEIDSLHKKQKRGTLILQPDFQRQYVWDDKKASKLIESVLLKVPLPIVYLAQERDGKELVIDGQQRLTSLFNFIDSKFALVGLTAYADLNKKHFSELEQRLQNAIQYYAIRVITILSDSDPDLKFDLFERLNTGAVSLNEMELRNCLYRGSYMSLLKELAADEEFRKLLGFKEVPKRMQDVELVLRFAAFYHKHYDHYKASMKSFFNEDMGIYQRISQKDADALRKAFRNALQIVKSLFGENAFKSYTRGTDSRNPKGDWSSGFNFSIYDVQMGVFGTQDKSQIHPVLDAIREGFIDLMTSNQDFIAAIHMGTSQRKRVKDRFNLTRRLVDNILQPHVSQPRCFSRQLKQQLFDQNPTCAICNQAISGLDDAAIDHIEQYWQGGKTIPENARLTHRYCNNARPRKG